MAPSNTDIGRIKNAEPTRIQTDVTKPLTKLLQYPLKPEVIQGLLPIIEDLITQGLVIPCISLYNIQILAVQKMNRRG